MHLQLDHDRELRPLAAADAATLFMTINSSRDQFDPWLRWSGSIISEQAALDFLANFTRNTDQGIFHLGHFLNDRLIGGVICWSRDQQTSVAELGYWLVPDVRGQGIAFSAVRAVMDALYADGIERIEFQCLVANARSRALAERLGGVLQGIRPGLHVVGGTRPDHALYAAVK